VCPRRGRHHCTAAPGGGELRCRCKPVAAWLLLLVCRGCRPMQLTPSQRSALASAATMVACARQCSQTCPALENMACGKCGHGVLSGYLYK
jgi:hypothetical protein